MADLMSTIQDLQAFTEGKKYNTIYADPPWQFQNRTGKVAPEHKRLTRYETMTISDIKALPVADITGDKAHLYLWVPNALLPDGLEVMDAWGFEYKGNIVWEKVRKDGGPDGRGGGKGGDVIFVVDQGLNTLIDFRNVRKYKAQDGEPGGKRNCRGKDGSDIVLKVPPGTVIKEAASGQLLLNRGRLSGSSGLILRLLRGIFHIPGGIGVFFAACGQAKAQRACQQKGKSALFHNFFLL